MKILNYEKNRVETLFLRGKFSEYSQFLPHSGKYSENLPKKLLEYSEYSKQKIGLMSY